MLQGPMVCANGNSYAQLAPIAKRPWPPWTRCRWNDSGLVPESRNGRPPGPGWTRIAGAGDQSLRALEQSGHQLPLHAQQRRLPDTSRTRGARRQTPCGVDFLSAQQESLLGVLGVLLLVQT